MAAKFFFRESPIGQLIYLSSGRKLLNYKEDRAAPQKPESRRSGSQETLVEDSRDGQQAKKRTKSSAEKSGKDVEKNKKNNGNDESKDPFLVGWDGDDDAENPQNWPMSYKVFVTVLMAWLTVSVYIGASIVEGGTRYFAAEYGLGTTPAGLLVTLFVYGYGGS